jgi:hypothetical protein
MAAFCRLGATLAPRIPAVLSAVAKTAAGIAFRLAVRWSVPMQCGLLRLNRILRDRPGPDRRGRSEPGAPVRSRRERCAPEPLAPGQKAERDSGWIVAVDNFS